MMPHTCTKTITCCMGYAILPVCLLAYVIFYGQVLDLPGTISQNKTKIVSNKVKSIGSNVAASIDDYRDNIGTCHIPFLEPYGPAVKRFIRVRKHYQCQHWNLITYHKEFKIIVNKTVIDKYYQMFSKCSYRPYTKKLDSHNAVLFLRNKFHNFTEFIKVTDEFCLVICFDGNDTVLTQQHFAFVIRNETLIRLRHSVTSLTNGTNLAAKKRMNVVMIGLESTSRLNFIRQMNFTRSFLQKEMAANELLGYNKVGLNTFPNIIPMLLGITREEMNDTRQFYDHYPFIWKDFKKAGYVTLMGQDGSWYSVFHYLCKGFKRAPVDYYMRPYVLGLERTNRNGLCSGKTLVLQSILDKMADFITTYHDVPHFTFTFICNPSHDDHNGLGIVDLPLTRTLTDLSTRGLLDNTVLLIFGDHGSRYGQIRNTYQGRLEENLPAFYVSLPRWFRKEHSDLYENLKVNRNKLTSNVDVYATLQDILELGRGQLTPRITGKYGTSLLRSINTNRTCGDLKIPSNFCTCQSSVETLSTRSKIVRNISQWVVKEINTILLNVSHSCSDLTLSTIRNAWRSVYNPTGKIMKNSISKKDFVIVIQFTVLPSNAEFEATVRYFKQKIVLLGDILRTNKYAGQPDCVSRHENAAVLERYCYCRK